MINLTEGTIILGQRKIRLSSDSEELDTLVKEGFIKKEKIGRGTDYYYLKCAAEDIRFEAFITLKLKKIDWIRFSWLDSSMKTWDDVSEKAVKKEYQFLLNIVEKTVGRPADSQGNRLRSWHFNWGQLDVCYDLRAFQADIFMRPKRLAATDN